MLEIRYLLCAELNSLTMATVPNVVWLGRSSCRQQRHGKLLLRHCVHRNHPWSIATAFLRWTTHPFCMVVSFMTDDRMSGEYRGEESTEADGDTHKCYLAGTCASPQTGIWKWAKDGHQLLKSSGEHSIHDYPYVGTHIGVCLWYVWPADTIECRY